MPAQVEVKRVEGAVGRRCFVDVPFRLHGHDPLWIPPLRMSVMDRISPRHPAMAHQEIALWIAYRNGKPAGRIGACRDSLFDAHNNEKWGWIGFFDSVKDPALAGALFDKACAWSLEKGAQRCVGPANFTTNDEVGLLVEGWEVPPTLLTLENPRYYEALWTGAGWTQAMDLWAWEFDLGTVALPERHKTTLARMRERAGVRLRQLDMSRYDEEVSRFFEVYNAAWRNNWGFAPMPEPEVRHLAKQLKTIIDPQFAVGLETASGEVVAVGLGLPDINPLMLRVRSGRLAPTGWYHLLAGRRDYTKVRIFALGVKPEYEHLALGPMLYSELMERCVAHPRLRGVEASWLLASNTRMNKVPEAMGGRRSKVWRLYQRGAESASPST
ncbi:MAG: hypothetical protein ACRDYC_12350 [Acidimicrobiales bacterium]